MSSLRFCPYEDVLGIGNSGGFCSIVVPGAGEPNYDLFEADPFESRKGTNNKVVHQLLDKLQPEMIQLDPNFIGGTPRKNISVERNLQKQADSQRKWARKSVTKNVKRGYRGVLIKRYAKYHHMKELHIRAKRVTEQLYLKKRAGWQEAKEQSKARKAAVAERLGGKTGGKERGGGAASALSRFGAFKEKAGHQKFKSAWRKSDKKIHF